MAFSPADIMLIDKEITRKSYNDIAFLLDRSLEKVRPLLNKWCMDNNIVSYQSILDAKAQTNRVRNKKVVPQKAKPSVHAEEQARRQARKERDAPKFQTRQVDYSKMITVRIDRKTVIYAKPGENVEEVRSRFMKRMSDKLKTLDQK